MPMWSMMLSHYVGEKNLKPDINTVKTGIRVIQIEKIQKILKLEMLPKNTIIKLKANQNLRN